MMMKNHWLVPIRLWIWMSCRLTCNMRVMTRCTSQWLIVAGGVSADNLYSSSDFLTSFLYIVSCKAALSSVGCWLWMEDINWRFKPAPLTLQCAILWKLSLQLFFAAWYMGDSYRVYFMQILRLIVWSDHSILYIYYIVIDIEGYHILWVWWKLIP